ncbi:hypothetical protein MNBD_GAMMA09-687 [hydrothermal vent metagenome]|uniref:Phosphatidic acid phosphatase type 2/haloperoxidase domain-containing protein n=1 Tax=hydrothermal vent metagenome TaxID=652676 RepID=A0A3B0Y0Y0_9ZZZZ
MKNLLQGVQISVDVKVMSRNILYVVPTFFIMSFLYLWSNHIAVTRLVENAILLDQLIPFIGWSIIIYWLVLVVAITGVLLLRDIRHVHRLLAVNALSFLLNFMVWFSYPIVYPRTEHLLTGISGELFSILYFLDTPANSFPSGHVSLMCLLAWTGMSLKGWRGHLLLVISVLGVFSVFTTRQHTVIDAIGGAATVMIAYAVVQLYVRLKSE